MRNALFLLVLTTLGCATLHAKGATSVGVPMRGQVLYPDGTPAAGARVIAETVCPEDTVHFVNDAKTGDDGSFSIVSFDPTCGRVRFSAEHRERYWLRTGDDVFYPSSNGTTPEIDISATNPPPPVTILLGARGGEIEFKVWDEATDRFIKAGLDIQREPVDRNEFGSISIATGEDGSSHTRFFPNGQYKVSVFYYPCRGKTFFVETRVWESFEVALGLTVEKRIVVNTAKLIAASSYDNPKGLKCQP